jgi:hypothetical protein
MVNLIRRQVVIDTGFSTKVSSDKFIKNKEPNQAILLNAFTG